MTAHVTEATSPPSDSKFGPDWFHRGTEGLEAMLRERWTEEPRTHYVGEWHSHTANVPLPSGQDVEQMRAVARDPRYECAQPLLVIACPVGEGQYVIKSYVFPGGTSPKELHMIDDSEREEADLGANASP